MARKRYSADRYADNIAYAHGVFTLTKYWDQAA